MEVKTPDWRIIERYNKDGTITKIKVDWNKIPCSTCEWRYHFGCPHCEWNKDGKYGEHLSLACLMSGNYRVGVQKEKVNFYILKGIMKNIKKFKHIQKNANIVVKLKQRQKKLI